MNIEAPNTGDTANQQGKFIESFSKLLETKMRSSPSMEVPRLAVRNRDLDYNSVIHWQGHLKPGSVIEERFVRINNSKNGIRTLDKLVLTYHASTTQYSEGDYQSALAVS